MSRPPVSVIVPFKGTRLDAERVVAQLKGMAVTPGDEFLLVDNSPRPIAVSEGTIRVLRAEARASSYYARNEGAQAARNEWLLFVDSDCLIPATLLDDYFSERPGEESGIVAGELVAASGQTAFTARYERSRGHLEVAQHMSMGPGPTGITANLLVRRATWSDLGGFHEVRSGADLEFCWRAQEIGWTLDYRPEARVEHLHTERLGDTLRKARRYGPGQAWVNRRFSNSAPPPRLASQVGRAVAGSMVWFVSGQFQRAAYKAMDGLWSVAFATGYWLDDNRPSPLLSAPHQHEQVVGVAVAFPAADGTSASPVRAGRVVAVRRPTRVRRSRLATTTIDYLEDTTVVERLGALCRIVVRHPVRCARDVRRYRGVGPRLRELAPAAAAVNRKRTDELLALDSESELLQVRLAELTGYVKRRRDGS
jgi:glycosyltransferase involved in cell wall biosynthesis